MSENRQIARAAGLIGFLTLLSRIAGLVRDAVVGYFFGTGAAADAFFVAFRVPNLLRRFVAEGAMSVAVIPVFTDYLTRRSKGEAVEAASAIATLMAVGLAVLTILGVVFAPQLAQVFAPGFVAEPGKLELTIRLTRWLFPYIFLVGLVALLSGLLNSVRHFAAPALSPVLLNLSIIAAAVLLCPLVEPPILGLAFGVLAGGFLQLAIQLPPLLRHGIRLAARWEPRHPAVRRTLGLMAPMVFGAAVYQVNIVVGTILASLLPSGSVSYLWYADRVFEFPLGVFAVAIGTAALPSFSAQVSRGAFDELRESLSFSVRMMNTIAVPAAVGMILLAEPIVSVLFERGAFGTAETRLTATALSAFAVGLWSVSIVRLVVPAFYALGDTRTPVETAFAAFVANVVFSLALMGPIETTGGGAVAVLAQLSRALSIADLRHAGLALATSLAATVNLVLLLLLLRRRLGEIRATGWLPSLARSAIGAAAMVLPVRWTVGFVWEATGALPVRAAGLGLAIVVGVGVFGAVVALLGGDEVRQLRQIVARRIRRPAA